VLVKFSGLLLAPILIAMLAARVWMPEPWKFLKRELATRGARAWGAVVICAACLVISYAMIWCTYGMRYAPTPGGQLLDTQRLLKMTAENELISQHSDRKPTEQEIAAWRPGLMLRTILFLEEHRLLPQAWTHGLHYTHMSVQIRYTYLLGDYSLTGWWYYFPLAMLFKTPLATLAAMALAAWVGVRCLKGKQLPQAQTWAICCVGLPVAVYGLFSVATNLNLGLRHLLPIYPLLFVAVGCAAAHMLKMRRGVTIVVLVLLGVGLSVESLRAFPNFIPFFNSAGGGSRAGIDLLGDSNLDWGQDLKLLAEWRRANPEHPLYLAYFGSAYPPYYGLDYTPLPGGYFFDEDARLPSPSEKAVIAISATHLQGIYHSERERALYQPFWERRNQALTVLGGTIYIFEWPLGTTR
jgi:hypothetical protein